MAAPKELIDRAKWLEGGIRRRANEHAWSYSRWLKKKNIMIWASLLATAASASSITTAIAQEPDLAWIAAALAALSAGVAGYERSVDPSGTAQRHAHAQTQLELLTSKFRHFTDYQATQVSPEEAEHLFELLESERQQLIPRLIEVEPEAHAALTPT